MKTVARIREELENLPATNHWERAVNNCAVNMFNDLVNSGELVYVKCINESDLLDGSKNWKEYSWNDCALCYNAHIRATFNPNDTGEQVQSSDGKAWLDAQAEALERSSKILLCIVNEEHSFSYKRDIKLRDGIIFGEYNPAKYSGGYRDIEDSRSFYFRIDEYPSGQIICGKNWHWASIHLSGSNTILL